MPNRREVRGFWFRLIAATMVMLAAMSAGAGAVEPGEQLTDPALEARARNLSSELRCLVCQNQSIDDSNAPLARDLRLLVRERLAAGDTDSEILDFVVTRYGEFVLLRPRLGVATIVLWLAPLVVLLGALWLARGVLRAGAADQQRDKGLSPEEERRLTEIVGEGRRHE